MILSGTSVWEVLKKKKIVSSGYFKYSWSNVVVFSALETKNYLSYDLYSSTSNNCSKLNKNFFLKTFLEVYIAKLHNQCRYEDSGTIISVVFYAA